MLLFDPGVLSNILVLDPDFIHVQSCCLFMHPNLELQSKWISSHIHTNNTF